MSSRAACLVFCAATACTSGIAAPPFPQQLTLGDLLSEAQAGDPYQATPSGQTVIPMSAVVTPPGMDIFFRAPPWGLPTDSYINSSGQPQLNILPGISEGHFVPYVTMELWTNDFGPVWIQPLYQLIEVDSNGNQVTPPMNQQQGMPGNPFVLSTAPPDRFYTPFWRFRNVMVPQSDWAQVMASPPQSERDVLDFPYPIYDGSLMLASIIPTNLLLDAPLLPPEGVPAGTVPLPGPQKGFAPWMNTILNADYTTTGLEQFVTVETVNTVFEGKPFTAIYFGEDWFTEAAGNTVPWTPIYAWATLDANQNPVPVGLPSIAGVDAPFSGGPWNAPGTVCNAAGVCSAAQPDWDAFWELYYVVVPAGAAPFFPAIPSPTPAAPAVSCSEETPCASGSVCLETTDAGTPDAGAPSDGGTDAGVQDAGSPAGPSASGTCAADLFAGDRGKFNAPTPSAFVSSLPNVARYAGRMALNPACFGDTSLPGSAPGSGTANLTSADTTAWASTCRFLDSQFALESNLTEESFIDSETSILCPLMLWAPFDTNP